MKNDDFGERREFIATHESTLKKVKLIQSNRLGRAESVLKLKKTNGHTGTRVILQHRSPEGGQIPMNFSHANLVT